VEHPVSPVVQWIRSAAIPLATTEPRHGLADLEALRPLVGDARIVSLGEATHGTREFFQLKHRLLEFCVAELGSRFSASRQIFPSRSPSTPMCWTASAMRPTRWPACAIGYVTPRRSSI
jgi:hypothetical protein